MPGLKMPFWHGIWAPKGTPPDVIARLNAAVMHALADPQVRARLTQMGQEILPREQQTPAALAAHHKAEVEKWGAVIKDNRREGRVILLRAVVTGSPACAGDDTRETTPP